MQRVSFPEALASDKASREPAVQDQETSGENAPLYANGAVNFDAVLASQKQGAYLARRSGPFLEAQVAAALEAEACPPKPRRRPGKPKPKPSATGTLLELQPDKHGAPLALTPRQHRLLQALHPTASRVLVRLVQRGFGGGLLLQTAAFDERERAEEPTLTKVGPAAALHEEAERYEKAGGHLGPLAVRVLRPPLYVHALGEEEDEEGELRVVDAEPTAAYSPAEHAEEADGAMVLELPGACWQLPEFAGAIPQRQEVPRAFSCRLWPPPISQ